MNLNDDPIYGDVIPGNLAIYELPVIRKYWPAVNKER